MNDYEAKLSGLTWQEVYARFYNSLLEFVTKWEELKTEGEKFVFVMNNDIGYSVEKFDQISMACQHIQGMPANPATHDEAAKIMILTLSVKAAPLRLMKDKHDIRMVDYMFYLTRNFY